jgi:predicted esterase
VDPSIAARVESRLAAAPPARACYRRFVNRIIAAVAGATLALTLASEADASEGWCAPELETLAGNVCVHVAEQQPARTLVIFLHGLVGDGSTWQWEQQRLMARLSQTYGFSALMPHGRLGIGPGKDPNTWAWPTSGKAQEVYEDQILGEWQAARSALEQRVGEFEKVLVFGFSNGAYYATSLALRGRLEVDGYGVFAGGSGNKYQKLQAARASKRSPIFVGYGTKDPDRRNQQALAKLLRSVHWPHRVRSARVGHTVTNDQVSEAVRFLTGADAQK